MKLFYKQLHKKKNGFTMMELLMVIAIIVILIGVSIPAVGTLRRNLRQRELDSKAEVIYMAAQSRLTQLRTGGFAELYGGVAGDGDRPISELDYGATVRGIDGLRRDFLPTDAINDNGEAENLCYVVSEESQDVAYVVLPQESVDKDLWNNNWIIEYDPEVGTVYAVFYSQQPMLSRASAERITDELNNLRSKPNRLADGATIGYYGGDLTQINVVDKDSMTASLQIINKEKLILDMTCVTAEKPVFKVTIEDSAGNRFVKTIDPTSIGQPKAGEFHATWTLDSLDSIASSFYAQTEGKLLCGTDITVRLDTSRDLGNGTSLTDFSQGTTNSLYAYRGDYAGTADTAYVAYGRHLQNLDNNTSHVLNVVRGVRSNVSKALQVQDISFLNSTDPDSYYAAYQDRLFAPIHNETITAYAGRVVGDNVVPAIKGLHIESIEPNVGLFSSFAGTIQDLRITGPKIQGGTSNVGTLMGSVLSSSRRTEIRNVQVYLSEALGDLPAQKADSVDKVTPWLKGRNVGGLIGSAASNQGLIIANSSASLPIEADRYAGGLVGTVNGSTTIYNSYADCYLVGNFVGGIIGGASQRGNIILQNFYAAGYGLAKETAAGIVTFDTVYNPLKNMTNGYSVMSLALNGEDPGKIYALAPKCVNTAVRTYYMPQNGVEYELVTIPGVESMSYEVLSSDQAFGYERTETGGTTVQVLGLAAPFQRNADSGAASYPYNLMDQGLNKYNFPKLTTAAGGIAINHYGDWLAQFEEGALVYFERDERGNYRFEGGNISVDNIRADASLQDYTQRTHIVADGYALAYTSPKGTSWDGVAALAGSTFELKNAESMTVANYTLYRLPADMLNSDTYATRDNKGTDGKLRFYQTLTVTENGEAKTYSFNPNFASCFDTGTAVPEVVRIRSPRQLYALSRLYDSYGGLLSQSTTFRQELDIDYTVYDWDKFYKAGVTSVSNQAPIGSESTPFFNAYDGRNNTIEGINIITNENQVGLFGATTVDGSISNLVLLGERIRENQPTQSYILRHKGNDSLSVANGLNQTVNMGALVGWNKGKITNCAVTGFQVNMAAYTGVTVNIGGLVGKNEGGNIASSSAETPKISLRNYSANTYAGGFVGDNSTGSVTNSYAAAYLEVREARLQTGNVSRIAGFTAKNDSGNLLRCYAGTPLMGSGDTEMYGFVSVGGSTIQCYYLDGGTYEYRGQIYSLNASENGRTQKGTTIDTDGLKARIGLLSGYGQAAGTYLGNEEKSFPYPEAVTRNGQYIHFGYWPNQDKDVGTFGVFYWEYEQGGNSGYHLTFQGTANGEPMQGGSTLCTAHDDGGVITEYGYGYFYKPTANLMAGEKDPLEPKLVLVNCELGTNGEYKKASQELQKQMPQYKFVAYRTSDAFYSEEDWTEITKGLHMAEGDTIDLALKQNSIWKLCYPYTEIKQGNETVVDEANSSVYTYSVSPFFGDAYNLVEIKLQGEAASVQNSGVRPGTTQAKSYQVRSVGQLQYINWNYGKVVATSTISPYHLSDMDWRYCRYPYLSYGKKDGTSQIIPDLYWKQTHDVDGTGWENYTPIGSMYDGSGTNRDANVTLAYFSSTYDGQAYVIKNINITSREQCVGIFGATSGAKMKNVILYSDNGSKIIHAQDAKSWYAVGGLVGLAGAPNGVETVFTNCTVSAYTIEDYQQSAPGWGGGCIGGLVGVCTVDLTNCTAVADIDVRIGYTSAWQNLRIGGLVGCARATINACYAGGSVADNSGQNFGNRNATTRIWVGGIVGGNVLRDGDPKAQGNLAALIGDTGKVTDVRNCYSFVNVPKRGTWGQKNRIHSSMAIASNGEMLDVCDDVQNDYITIHNCYALDSTAQKGDDYEQLQKKQQYNDVNLNFIQPNETKRRVQMFNDHNPIVSYQEMQTILMDLLNNGITGNVAKFAPVTTTENTASINGKYSFPGGDAQLAGLDYPFPTILTQQDVDGDTVHVHYGAWPKFGIYWEEHKATLDLVADRNTTGVDLLALYGDPEPEDPVLETDGLEVMEPETTEPEETIPEPTMPETAAPEAAAPEEVVSEAVTLEAAEAVTDTETPVSDETEGEVREFTTLEANTLQAALDYRLYVAGLDTAGIGAPVYELLDETGTKIQDESKAAARILTFDTTLTDDYFPITFLGQHPGTVLVQATVEKDGASYTATLTLTVTADLNISVDETRLPLTTYVGDPVADLEVTLKDTKGSQFTPGANAKLEWELTIDAQESETDLVTWTRDGFLIGDEAPFYLTSLKGFSPGEGSLKLTLTYTWDLSDGVQADPVVTSVILPIEVLPSDVLGLGDGTAGQEVEIPHTPVDGSFTGTKRTDEENVPTLEGQTLFLYASNETNTDGVLTSYTDLSAFRVTKAELKRGGGYAAMTPVLPGEGEPVPDYDAFAYQAGDDTITFQISKQTVTTGTRNQRFTYRPITVLGDQAEQWTLRLTLVAVDAQGNDLNRTYTLEYDRPNTVTFAYGQEDSTAVTLKTYRVEQGEDLSRLDQDDLDGELEKIAQGLGLNITTTEGHHYTWTIPQGTLTQNVTVTQRSAPIRYYVNYYAGYDDYEWDDNVPMEKDTFTYGQEDKRLKANTYNRPGYNFAGWAVTEGGEMAFTDGQEFTDEAIFHGEEYSHNRNLNLYAVWVPRVYTIAYNGDFPGWDAEGNPTMEPSTYSIGATEGTLRANAFVREGYAFRGWAYESGKTAPDLEADATLETVMHRGGEYVVYSDVTLYAVWQQNEPQQAEEPQTDAVSDDAADQEETLDTPEAPAEPEEAPAEPVEESTEPTQEPAQAPQVEEAPQTEGDTEEKDEPEEET